MIKHPHHTPDPLRAFGLRFRRQIRPIILPLALCLLGVNLFYTFTVVGKKVDPDSRRITHTLQTIDAETRPIAENWLDSQNDTAYIRRFWQAEPPTAWAEKGTSLLLFRDTALVYWSDASFLSDIDAFRPSPPHTFREIGTRQILTRTESRNGKSAVVAIDLYDRKSGRYNPALFPEQRIALLSAGDSIRARLVQAERIATDGYDFFVEARPVRNMPWWAELCGWGSILLLCLFAKNIVRRHTTRHNAFRNAGMLLLLFVLLRIGVHYAGLPNANGVLFAKIYGLHNLVLGSLGDLLLSYSLFFVFVAYLFQIRAKLSWRYRRYGRPGRILTGLAACAMIACVVSVFHYALILSIYSPNINMQIYDLFDLSYASIMFYLLTVLFVSSRLLIAHTGLILFGTRRMALRIGLTAAMILLLLAPLETQIHRTGYLLVVFYLISDGADYIRRHYNHYGSFVISLVIFSSYIAYFAFQEERAAQNNVQRLYARILATSPQDVAITSAEGQQTGEPYSDVRFRHFTYARFIDNRIIFKPDNGNDYRELEACIAAGRDTTLTHDGQTHFFYNYYGQDGRHGLLVVSRKAITALDAVSLYAYIFLLLFILCGLLLEIAGYTFGIQRLGTRMMFKIRTVVIGIVLFSMLSVTFVIVDHTLADLRNKQRRFVNNNMQRLSSNLVRFLDSAPLDRRTAQEWIDRMSQETEYGINLYAPTGERLGTSSMRPERPARMNSSAYRHLHYSGAPFYATGPDNGQYTSAFAPIVTDGRTIGYLNLEHDDSGGSNRILQYELLADILNLFLIILCVAVMLSEFLYRLLAKPFNQLHEAMGNISEMRKIDAIGSGRKISDEVGMLVEQYNTMIDYLEESYRRLARSEREGAWREMARQVAHEIKNPLTPMRLKIQMLQRYLRQSEDNDLKARVESTLTLLIDQIDLLTKIASEFSDFARLGEGNPVQIDLVPLVCRVAGLYSGDDRIEVRLRFECGCRPEREVSDGGMPQTGDVSPAVPGPVWVTADPDHLTRVFVNICQNAVQAMAGQKHARIDIDLHTEDGWVRVSFRDNGPGIPEEVREKIFTPNFTTKSSGSGLGLALSRKIVELLGGRISFESIPGIGTTFTVDLPIDMAVGSAVS